MENLINLSETTNTHSLRYIYINIMKQEVLRNISKIYKNDIL